MCSRGNLICRESANLAHLHFNNFESLFNFESRDHSILECYNLFSGVELSMRSFFVIYVISYFKLIYNWFRGS